MPKGLGHGTFLMHSIVYKKTKSWVPIWNGRDGKQKIIILNKNDKFEVFSNYAVTADQVEGRKKRTQMSLHSEK